MSSVEPLQNNGADWIRRSFLVPRLAANQADANKQRSQWYSSRSQLYGLAATKFTDTALGGNFAINTPPQYNKYADLRVPSFTQNSGGADRYGRYKKNTAALAGGNGMGRYYSEAIDDNSQLIYMRMGKPEFNSLTTFFTGFYNAEASLLARRGRSSNLFYDVGKVAGTIASIPFAPLIAAGTIFRWLAQAPASKFYYLRPTMPLYWNAVNTIANGIAVNMGIYPRPATDEEIAVATAAGDPDAAVTLTQGDAARMHDLLPDIYHPKGGIDIYALANRATRLAHQQEENLRNLVENSNSNEELQQNMTNFLSSEWSDPGSQGIDKALLNFHQSGLGQETSPNPEDSGRGGGSGDAESKTWNSVKGWYKDLVAFGEAELADGSAFACFRVDFTGTASESFSSSVRESDVSSSMNSGSASARNARFNFAEGNVVGGGIGSIVQGAVSAVKDVATGVIDGVQMSGLLALAGSAFVDIPKHWDNSSANLTTMSYTMQLQAWSGDKYTRYQSLMIPLSMILAAALPNSTGMKSYTAPFLVELYSKGKAQTRLGIIDNLTITRGTGNVGWTKDREPLGIDITFSVIDLSSIMHMPIASNFSLNPFSGVFDDDNAFNDYLAVLGSLGLSDQVYVRKRLRLAMSRKMLSFRQWTSPARYASWANGTDIGRLINGLSREIGRP